MGWQEQQKQCFMKHRKHSDLTWIIVLPAARKVQPSWGMNIARGWTVTTSSFPVRNKHRALRNASANHPSLQSVCYFKCTNCATIASSNLFASSVYESFVWLKKTKAYFPSRFWIRQKSTIDGILYDINIYSYHDCAIKLKSTQITQKLNKNITKHCLWVKSYTYLKHYIHVL